MLNQFKQNQVQNISKEDIDNPPRTLLEFDGVSRSKAWGYNSVNELYREISCGHFLSYIDIPFMILTSNDDPISAKRHVPYVDILGNRNGLLI